MMAPLDPNLPILEAEPAPPVEAVPETVGEPRALGEIAKLNDELERRYKGRFSLHPALSRSLVSFQANKGRAVYRWFKYKEAFSAGLVEFLLNKYRVWGGVLLDPFAGIGTALFAAGALGMRAEGIELLPIGQCVIATKQLIDWRIERRDIDTLAKWAVEQPWKECKAVDALNELRITRGAYPPDTLRAAGRFLAAMKAENERVEAVLLFALLCVLESVSFTRKDGQYLRWDHRSGRRQGKKIFDKGEILSFDKAICGKLGEIVADLRSRENPHDLFATTPPQADITLHRGSCLEVLPGLPAGTYDAIMTSPPYCNRYDYTRTYALELALLGVDEAGLSKLRQEMVSCTVENRAKNLRAMNPAWGQAVKAADDQPLLQKILAYLDNQRRMNRLNNNGIPRMVRGYFYEMACVIFECGRVLRPHAPLIMVNDNVRYAGASISVDILLSELARAAGFEIESILVLPNGKGNSSQQMGAHGREALRKCVYIWRKAAG
jgi:DNA modification methylase